MDPEVYSIIAYCVDSCGEVYTQYLEENPFLVPTAQVIDIAKERSIDTVVAEMSSQIRQATPPISIVPPSLTNLKPTNMYDPGLYDTGEEHLDDLLHRTEKIIEASYLGPNILGLYNPNTDEIYLRSDLSAREKRYVLEHERAHREQHYVGGSQDEELVDLIATSRLGYNPFPQRNPGYQQYSAKPATIIPIAPRVQNRYAA